MQTIDCCLVVLIGPPGVGKGTLASKCVEKIGFRSISTGEMLRSHVAAGTDLGIKVKEFLDRGELVSDHLVDEIFSDWLSNSFARESSYFLVDGYPRTVVQAKFLVEILNQKNLLNVSKVFLMEAPEDVVRSRIMGRLVCSNEKCRKIFSSQDCNTFNCSECGSELTRRGDDNLECMKRRWYGYIQTKDELVDFFKKMGLEIKVVDTQSKTPEEVFEDFKNFVMGGSSSGR